MPKKPTVTELDTRIKAIEDDLPTIKADAENIKATGNARESQWRQELKKVVEDVGRNQSAALQTATDGLAADLQANVKALQDRLAQLEEILQSSISSVAKDIEARMSDSSASLRAEIDREIERRSHIEADTNNQFGEVSETLERWGKDTAEAFVQQRTEVDAAFKEVDQKLQALGEQHDEKVTAEIKHVTEQHTKASAKHSEKLQSAEAELYIVLDRQKELLEELKENAEAGVTDVRATLESEIAGIREGMQQRIDNAEHDITTLRESYADCENISTRRVDWVIKNASKQLRHQERLVKKAQLHTGWFSPKFYVSGAASLQLEFHLFRPADPPMPEEANGDCSIFLWANRGMNLIFKLYIGDKSSTTFERVFNGRVPYGVERLCFLKDQINREDDTLHLRVEVLEAVREVEHPVEATPLMTEEEEAGKPALAKAR
jgi:hypothetical protein